jgi:hypothetical protein
MVFIPFKFSDSCFSYHTVWTVPVSFLALFTSGPQPGVRVPAVVRDLTSLKTKHRNRLNLDPALILALTKIRPPIEVLACQK